MTSCQEMRQIIVWLKNKINYFQSFLWLNKMFRKEVIPKTKDMFLKMSAFLIHCLYYWDFVGDLCQKYCKHFDEQHSYGLHVSHNIKCI